MPNGLYMINPDGHIAVVNRAFTDMMKLNNDFAYRDATVRDIVSEAITAKTLSQASADAIVAEVEASRAGDIVTIDASPSGDRALSWTFQPMEGGGTVVLVEDITERRNAEAKISHMARVDELTGLPNRVSFRDEIERSSRPLRTEVRCLHCSSSISISSSRSTIPWATPSGDKLLCAVTARLRRLLRPQDFVARFGGDEFVVFQRGIHSTEDAASLARRIVDRLSERYEIDHHLVEIGASIGIALTSPDVSADILLKNADMALYRAKADGPRHVLFLPRGNGAHCRGAACARARSASRARARGVRAVLSAAGESEVRTDFDLRSAAALESSDTRIGVAGRHHPVCRGHGPRRGSGPVDSAQGLHGVHEMAGSGQRRREFLAAAIPSARRHDRSSLRAGSVRPCPRTGWKSRSPKSSLLRNTQWTADAFVAIARGRCPGFRWTILAPAIRV